MRACAAPQPPQLKHHHHHHRSAFGFPSALSVFCLRGRRCGRPLVGPAKRVHWPGSVSHPPQKHRQHRASLNICVRTRTAGICAALVGASSSCTPYPGRVVCVCASTHPRPWFVKRVDAAAAQLLRRDPRGFDDTRIWQHTHIITKIVCVLLQGTMAGDWG